MVTTGWNGANIANTEVVDLSNNCTVPLPNYPIPLSTTTGQFFQDKAIICGGYKFSGCYGLSKGATSFQSISSMKEARSNAKSIVTQGHMWVTGGRNGNLLSSTEYIKESTTIGPDLPEPMSSHAIITINETTLMLIGGYSEHNSKSPKTYYFNQLSQTWKEGPSLITGRREHTAGLIMDLVTHTQHIAVIGGIDDRLLKSVEILFNGETEWKKGIIYFVSFLYNINMIQHWCFWGKVSALLAPSMRYDIVTTLYIIVPPMVVRMSEIFLYILSSLEWLNISQIQKK